MNHTLRVTKTDYWTGPYLTNLYSPIKLNCWLKRPCLVTGPLLKPPGTDRYWSPSWETCVTLKPWLSGSFHSQLTTYEMISRSHHPILYKNDNSNKIITMAINVPNKYFLLMIKKVVVCITTLTPTHTFPLIKLIMSWDLKSQLTLH